MQAKQAKFAETHANELQQSQQQPQQSSSSTTTTQNESSSSSTSTSTSTSMIEEKGPKSQPIDNNEDQKNDSGLVNN